VCNASIRAIRHRVDIDTLEEIPASTLVLNDIARCAIAADQELLFDPYAVNRQTGSFILVNRLTNATVAAGMIIEASSAWDRTPVASLNRQVSAITGEERAQRFDQRPVTILFTGLTSAGKSTIATSLERRLFDAGKSTVRLDGENVRMGISRDLGFSAQERSENLRRVSELARLVNDQGLIALAALVAPKESVRDRARELVGDDRYIEVFVDTPIEICRERDEHGLYEAADRGEIPQFPGVSATYDRPTDTDLRIDTVEQSVEQCVDVIIELLDRRGFLRGEPGDV
jgi:bifunctional enzyme CysN/CysC